ncbi:uncharacterized protein LOC121859039, partial [Homarus americanus]|uniref:uncharacterized protein LOC121859039 n=1 Tax=Homarus americanus TaxID=6706 RepID=UPI001C48D0A5
DEGERLVRRVSYLKATSGDRMYSDSDLDSDNDDRSGLRVEGGEEASVVGGVSVASSEPAPGTPAGPLCVGDLPSPASLQSAVLRQGALHVKLTMVDGKRLVTGRGRRCGRWWWVTQLYFTRIDSTPGR